MLGRMPTPQVVALLKASGPAHAADTLLTFPVERIAALLAAMQPADLAGVLTASTVAQKRQLLPAMTTEQTLLVLGRLTNGQVADVMAGIPAAQATSLLTVAPAQLAMRILSALPNSTMAAVDTSLSSDRAAELYSMRYEQQVVESVTRIAGRVSRLPSSTCDMVVDVLHHAVQVAVRYRGHGVLTDDDVEAAAMAADWTQVAGLLVVSDAEPTAAALRHGSAVYAAGYRLELLRWNNRGDNGALKRALVRLGG